MNIGTWKKKEFIIIQFCNSSGRLVSLNNNNNNNKIKEYIISLSRVNILILSFSLHFLFNINYIIIHHSLKKTTFFFIKRE
jgi:hypothetical protein